MTRIDFIQAALLSGTDDCIPWPYALRNSGYGAYDETVGLKKKNYDIHRRVCTLAHGEPEIGEEAAHSCGNKLCINPNHLSWKYPKENMQDAIDQGTLRGGGSGRQRISLFDRLTIRGSTEPYSTLAARYGTDIAYIGKLRRMPLPHGLEG